MSVAATPVEDPAAGCQPDDLSVQSVESAAVPSIASQPPVPQALDHQATTAEATDSTSEPKLTDPTSKPKLTSEPEPKLARVESVADDTKTDVIEGGDQWSSSSSEGAGEAAPHVPYIQATMLRFQSGAHAVQGASVLCPPDGIPLTSCQGLGHRWRTPTSSPRG